MGIGDLLNPKDTIREGISGAVNENIPKLQAALEDSARRIRTIAYETLDETVPRLKRALEESADLAISKVQAGTDDTIARVRQAADQFLGDLEKKWEDRLEKETREQFKLLNRVLLYTLVMAAIALAYAVAKKGLGL